MLFLVIGAVTIFAIIGIWQLRSLSQMSREVGEAQADTIKSTSGETMMRITEQNMDIITQETVENVDGEF